MACQKKEKKHYTRTSIWPLGGVGRAEGEARVLTTQARRETRHAATLARPRASRPLHFAASHRGCCGRLARIFSELASSVTS